MRHYSNIEVISFDLVGTLVRRDFIDYFWQRAIPEAVARKNEWNSRKARNWVFAEYQKISKDDLRWHIPSYWTSRFGLSVDPLLLFEPSIRILGMYCDAKAIIPRISKQHKIVIATNISNDLLKPALRKLEVPFDGIFSSVSDYLLPTKTPEFYLRLMKDVGAEPGNFIHIGDDPTQDYRNPKKAGTNALLIARGPIRTRYAHIRNLKALEELCSGH